jgi:hypothetical protein
MNENKTEWMLDLNKYEDIATNVKSMHKLILLLYLTDKKLEFGYTEADFCLFKFFPSNRFVYPIIKTKPALNCTCTLMWLIKNYKAYLTTQLLNVVKTSSIDACLNIENTEFNRKLEECRFDNRLYQCDSQRFPTTRIGADGSLITMTSTRKKIEQTERRRTRTSSKSPVIGEQTDHEYYDTKSEGGNENDNYGDDIGGGGGDYVNDKQKATVRAMAVFIATVGFFSISAILGFVLFMYK